MITRFAFLGKGGQKGSKKGWLAVAFSAGGLERESVVMCRKVKYNINITIKNMQQEEFYTAQELADKLRVNIMTIYRYIKAGKLNAYKTGKDFRIEKKEFDKFLEKAKAN